MAIQHVASGLCIMKANLDVKWSCAKLEKLKVVNKNKSGHKEDNDEDE
jgi:hypothetical protein